MTAYGPTMFPSPSSTPSPINADGWMRLATEGPFVGGRLNCANGLGFEVGLGRPVTWARVEGHRTQNRRLTVPDAPKPPAERDCR
jgi:hypothetical protein